MRCARGTNGRVGLLCAAVAVMLVSASCGTNDGRVVVVADDLAARELAVATAEQALDAGQTPEEAIQALVAAVENDPQVLAAAVDDEDPCNAWVLYASGTEHFFEAVDLDEEVLAGEAATAEGRWPAGLEDGAVPAASGVGQAKALATAQAAGLTPNWVMPASRRALLVNALTRCHPLRDVRPTVKKMLTDRGYEVEDTLPLDIELFRNNTLMNYGVIFMETHGGIRTKDERYWERVMARFYKLAGVNVPYCAAPGGAYVISTDVLVSADLDREYRQDLDCGLLKHTTTFIKVGGRDVPCVTTYGVTPDYIRRYNTARFPDNTLVCMNACRTFSPDVESEWANLLAERCTGYHLFGWTNRVHYDTSATAFLNLLQLATGSDEYLTMFVPGLADPNVPLLKQNVPPVGVSPVVAAATALGTRGYDVDVTKGKRKGTGARLVFSMDFTPEVPIELVLAPALRDFYIDQTGQTGLFAACQDHAELRIEHGKTQSGVTTVDIGTAGAFTLGGGWVNCLGGAWHFPLPVGSAGPITLVQDGRKGPAHDMLVWRPVFKITGTGSHNMTFVVEFQMQARAIPASRWRSLCVGPTAWNKPNDQFDAKFDGGASVVTWTVSGVHEDPPGVTRYAYSGGGVKNLSFVDAQGGLYTADFRSLDGQTADAVFDCSAVLPFTETITDLTNNQSTTNEQLLPVGSLALHGLPLAADWTLTAGSQPLALSSSYNGTVSWGDAQPTPPYNATTMRR